MVFLFTGLYDMAFQVERKNKIRYTTGEVLNYLLAPGDDSDLSGLSDSDDNEIQESLNETDVVWDDQNETVEDNINAEREIESHAQAIREHTGASVPSTHAVVAGPSSFDDNRQKVPVTRQRSMISSSKKNDDDLNSELLDSDVVEPEDTFSDEEDEKITDAMRSHNFRWRNIEPPRDQRVFTGSPFSLPPEEFDDLQPYDFFTKFWSDDMTKLLVEQTNLYSVQATGKSVNTNFAEMEQLLGIHMMMGIINMPTYHYYWDSETRIGLIADAMSHNRYKALRRSIHVADNTFRDSRKNDKLFKIRPILEKLRENCLKIEPEPVMSIDEQIIPAKTRRSGIRQYNPKKPIKWGFKMGGLDANSAIIVMKWFDNKTIHLVSNYCTSAASSQVKRWDGSKKKNVLIDCPDIVKEYNSAMGGVDLADMLISLYRTPWKSKRWYLRVLVHCIDIAKVNAWLLYRRCAEQLQIPKRKQMALCKFSSKIAHSLLHAISLLIVLLVGP